MNDHAFGRGRPYVGYLTPHVEEILRLYDAGQSTTKIARFLIADRGVLPPSATCLISVPCLSIESCIVSSVRTVLKRHGRNIKKPSREDRNQSIVAMREAGATLKAVGIHYGVSPERVRQLVSKHERIRARLRTEGSR